MPSSAKVIEWLYDKLKELSFLTAGGAILAGLSWKKLEERLMTPALYSIPTFLLLFGIILFLVVLRMKRHPVYAGNYAAPNPAAVDSSSIIILPKGFTVRMSSVDRRQYEGASVNVAKIFFNVDHGLAQQRLRFECDVPLCIGACKFAFQDNGDFKLVSMVSPGTDSKSINVSFSPAQAVSPGILHAELAANDPVQVRRVVRQEFLHHSHQWVDVD